MRTVEARGGAGSKDDGVAQTYSSLPSIEGRKFICKRCRRVYPYPEDDGRPIRCECGWWYWNERGKIREAFRQRIDPPPS